LLWAGWQGWIAGLATGHLALLLPPSQSDGPPACVNPAVEESAWNGAEGAVPGWVDEPVLSWLEGLNRKLHSWQRKTSLSWEDFLISLTNLVE